MGILDGDLKSDLKEIGENQRKIMLARNKYSKSDKYDESNPDSQSNGDRLGRGDGSSPQNGTADDIAARERMLAKNLYKKGREYRIID